ncbi:kinase-like protein [Cryomyces antarcticus]
MPSSSSSSPSSFSSPLSSKPTAPTHALPAPFDSTSCTLITQGAEALLYRTSFLSHPSTSSSSAGNCALKHRPSKPYRHAVLDKRLTRARILAEARVLIRCRREGVPVPAVLGLDWEEGWVALEWVEGVTVRRGVDEFVNEGRGEEGEEGLGDRKKEREAALRDLMVRIGRAVGRLHAIDVVHGDLTTSNLMLRSPSSSSSGIVRQSGSTSPNASVPLTTLAGDIILIDFGLAAQNALDEDKAVDLYVLERAFGSTHPYAEKFLDSMLAGYRDSYKGAKVVLRRLEDVRMRGRKKSMLG